MGKEGRERWGDGGKFQKKKKPKYYTGSVYTSTTITVVALHMQSKSKYISQNKMTESDQQQKL